MHRAQSHLIRSIKYSTYTEIQEQRRKIPSSTDLNESDLYSTVYSDINNVSPCWNDNIGLSYVYFTQRNLCHYAHKTCSDWKIQ